MSFHDGVSIASIFDGVNVKGLITLLTDHEIFVGPSILSNHEYLYYVIGNCNNVQQDAIRHDAIDRFHGVSYVSARLLTFVLAYIWKMQCHDSSVTTHYTWKELLSRLHDTDLKNITRDRGWDTSDPRFIDGTAIEPILRDHQKAGIVEAFRSASGLDIFPYDLLREKKSTLYQFCSLLDRNALQDFRGRLEEQVRPLVFSNGSSISNEYQLIATPVLEWSCRHYCQDRHVNSTGPTFANNTMMNLNFRGNGTPKTRRVMVNDGDNWL
ncbi:hypothetical protein EDD18DRAFT_1110380 [Armillaria luteobubalina]|uniref:Uncharacterized protein n=1 Tax=Armillaria luteobubalina TaxID=153913 RepID=A0AA39TGW6_9AGAR|nr:hypothetical protein EDD18DRAFT_1110380 [Armillaria luteobubalina]